MSPVEVTPALLAAYNQWLFYERRLLCIEMFPESKELARLAEHYTPLDTAAGDFHFPMMSEGRDWRDVPPPSTRAASILGALGIDWRAGDDSRGGARRRPFVFGSLAHATDDPRDDAELIRLGEQLDPLMAELKAIWPEYRRACNALEALRSEHKAEWLGHYAAGRDEEARALGNRWEDETGFRPVSDRVMQLDNALEPIIDAIMAEDARTIVGLGVKARAAVWALLGLKEAPDEEPDDYGDQIQRNLIVAVLALTGGSVSA